jgi:hypothetical protein
MSMSIPRKEIKRKELPTREVEEPQLAHLKETGASDTAAWEVPGDAQNNRKNKLVGAGAGWALSDRLDRILPPHKRYLGRSRRTLLIAILVAFLCLLALVIGLAVGLSKKSE